MNEPALSDTLPRWDMTVVYPSLDSPEFAAGFADMRDRVARLGVLFDELGVFAPSAPGFRRAATADFDRAIDAYNQTIDAYGIIASYLSAFTATDSRDEVAQARQSEADGQGVTLSKLGRRWTAWLGNQDTEQLIAESATAREHAFHLSQEATLARHQMAPGEEALAADLGASGGEAWARLHDTVTSQIEASVMIGGEAKVLPMSEIRNLALSPEREIREAAWTAEQGALHLWAAPLAAALNGIKGADNTVAARRGWNDQLEIACFQNAIDRETLDAMISETRAAFPHFRRYLRAKARLIGVDRLAWFDLFAPVGDPGRSWEWLDAVGLLESEFGTFSPNLGRLMSRAVQERWIDAGPRPGKQGGAFCNSLRADESRILMNFTPSFDSVSTLAHEMGHAYHNLCASGLTPIQRYPPMTLAETASTFCETMVYDALLEQSEGSERLFMLEQSLQGSTQVAVDIISRYDFERAVFRERRDRELTIGEFCGLMTDAQLATYGDGLDPERLHPWMWALKSHYYADGAPFYNFPYLFGQLFGLGLYARYRREPGGFVPRYEQLLRFSGMSDAAGLAASFGIDLRDGEFWRDSLKTIVANIDRFESLVDAALAT